MKRSSLFLVTLCACIWLSVSIDNCPDYQFNDTQKGNCSYCSEYASLACKKCEISYNYPNNGNVTCTVCATQYEEVNPTTGNCTLNCTRGHAACQQCNLNGDKFVCTSCTGAYATLGGNCKACMAGCSQCRFEPTGQESCYSVSSSDYYLNPSSQTAELCSKTLAGCKTCQFNLTTKTAWCLSVQNDYYKIDPSNGQTYLDCKLADQNCSRCAIGLNNQMQCLECSAPYRQLNGVCEPNCTYNDPNCKVCSIVNQGVVCESCTESYYLNPNNFCDKCADNCVSCQMQNDALICLKCLDAFMPSTDAKTCIKKMTSCPEKQYLSNGQCLYCSEKNCKLCPNDKCSECVSDNYVLTDSSICKPNCQKIDPNCAECIVENQALKCTYCSMSYLLDPTTSLCKKCPDNCNVCRQQENVTICAECNQGYFPQKQKTVCVKPNCLIGQYYSIEGEMCRDCTIQNCAHCIVDEIKKVETCQECKAYHFLNRTEQTCKLSCRIGLNHCTECSIPDALSNSTFACLKCEPGYEYNPKTKLCDQVCKDNQFQIQNPTSNEIYCKDCPVSCTKCYFDYTTQKPKCSACIDSYILNPLQLCMPSVTANCKQGEYFNLTTGSCNKCPEGCYSCLYSTASFNGIICTNCTDSFISDGQNCRKKCPEMNQRPILQFNQLTQSWNQQCVPCKPSCLRCSSTQNFDELCAVCMDTHITTKEGCVEKKQCSPSQYLYIAQISNIFQEQKCVDCPSVCTSCQIYNQSLTCESCIDGYVLNNDKKCQLEVNQVVCAEGQYNYINYTEKQSVCGNCSANCLKCLTSSSCLYCASGYTLVSGACSLLSCKEGQYMAFYSANRDAHKCLSCPAECTKCSLFNDMNPDSPLLCQACAVGYLQTKDNKCVLNQTSLQCRNGQYKFKLASDGQEYEKCMNCPLGCQTCSLENAQVVCQACQTGFTLKNTLCVSVCDPKSSYLIVDPSGSYCKQCDISCLGCQDSPRNCIECAQNYKKGPSGCEKIQVTNVDCGKGYFDSASQVCKCYESSAYFNRETKTCDAISSVSDTCGVGQYWQKELKQCLACSANQCKLCPDNLCRICSAGYFLNTAQQCQSCSANCDVCANDLICRTCKPGYYMYKARNNTDGKDMALCGAQCPAGYLPYLPSLYYLNPTLFSQDKMKEIYASLTEAPVSDKGDAIAVGINNSPVYSVDWEMKEGLLYFDGALINLDCAPCFKGCKTCASGYYLQGKLCVPKCSSGFKPDEVSRTCVEVKEEDLFIMSLSAKTLTVDNIQPSNKDLRVVLELGGAKVNYKVSWSLENAVDTSSNNQLSDSDIKILSQQFFAGSRQGSSELRVPYYNLKSMFIYVIKVTISTDTRTLSQTLKIYVKYVSDIREMADLGISEELIKVTPAEGTSGTTEFQAIYSFGNVKAISSNLDSFKFKIEVSSGLVLQSSKPDDVLKFYVPPNKKQSQTLEVKFTIFDKQYQYQAYRKIFVKQNENYDIRQDATLQKIENKVNLTLDEMVLGAQLVGEQAKNLSGVDNSTKELLAKANKAILEQLSKVKSENNIDSQINALKQVAKTNLMDDESKNMFSQKVANISTSIKDVDSLTQFIGLVQEQKNLTRQDQKEEFKVFNNIVNSAKKVASATLNQDNVEQTYAEGDIIGKNTFVNKSEIPETGQIFSLKKDEYTSTSIRLQKIAFQQEGMITTTILTNRSSVFSNSNSKIPLLEVTVADQNGVAQKVESDQEVIEFNLTVANKTGKYKCQYYDPTENQFSTRNCSRKGDVKENKEDKSYYITCGCSHLSLMSAEEYVDNTNPKDKTDEIYGHNIYVPLLTIVIAILSILI